MRILAIVAGLIVVLIGVLFISPLFTRSTVDSVPININYYGTIGLETEDNRVVTDGENVTSDSLVLTLDFRVDVRPTALEAYLVLNGKGVAEIATFIKHSTQWQWIFPLNNIPEGKNQYYVWIAGNYGSQMISHKSVTFYLTGE